MTYQALNLDYDSAMAAYWGTQLINPGATVHSVPAANIGGSIMAVAFSRAVAATVTEDTAIFTVHFCMRPGTAGLSSTLSDSDSAAVESSFNTNWWTPVKGITSSGWSLKDYTWRDFKADFPKDDNGFSKPGPIRRVTPVGQAGGASATRLPDQVAATVTYQTASRKHWGRSYHGGLTGAALAGSFGHLLPAYVDILSNAWDSFFENIGSLGRVIEPVVWSAKYRGMFSVTHTVVDDVPDVIRSRRAKFATYRKSGG